ncbi:MAG TPA: hypothetical protein VKA55_11665 [Gammaproteobacteria bacterium]|nr:hypothetical protein [Gammaproteobacteria bacterium]
MRGVAALMLLLAAAAAAAERPADSDKKSAGEPEASAPRDLPGVELPGPRLSDRPFRPVPPSRSGEDAAADERGCCSSEH